MPRAPHPAGPYPSARRRTPGRDHTAVLAALLVPALTLAACGESAGPASFQEEETVAVQVSATGEGAGLLVADPWIRCGYDGARVTGTCDAEVPRGTSLALIALPRDSAVNGTTFAGWEGPCSGSDEAVCRVTAGEVPLSISAEFLATTRLHGTLHRAEGTQEGLGSLAIELRLDTISLGRIAVAADGNFDARLVGSTRTAPNLQVIVDSKNRSVRSFFPAYIQLKPWELADPLQLVMVPLAWTITDGAHAGERVPLDLNEVLGVDPNLYLTTGQALVAKNWQFQVQTVTRDRLPLTLAVDAAGSTATVWDIDVTRYWRRIDELEAAVGMDLYAPADGTASADVVVRVIPGACGRATACANVVSGNPYLLGGSSVFHQSVEQFRSGRGIVAHELTHVLGMGHTCRWTSLMSIGPEECADEDISSDVATARDVAYLHLALAVNSLQKERGLPPYGGGLMAAWNGQRVVLDGVGPWLPPECAQCARGSAPAR